MNDDSDDGEGKEQTRTFEDFEGYDGEEDTNVVEEHDAWPVE